MFNGLLIRESVTDQSVLDGVETANERQVQVDNPADDQPSLWTLVDFKVTEDVAAAFAKRVAQVLKQGTWYVDFTSDTTKFVVFPGKVFQYERGDEDTQREAMAFGRALGIPEKQLEWSE